MTNARYLASASVRLRVPTTNYLALSRLYLRHDRRHTGFWSSSPGDPSPEAGE